MAELLSIVPFLCWRKLVLNCFVQAEDMVDLAGAERQSGLKRAPMTSMDELITMSDNFSDDCVSYLGYGTSGLMFYGETMSRQRLTFRKIEYYKHTPLSDVEFLDQVHMQVVMADNLTGEKQSLSLCNASAYCLELMFATISG